MCIEYITLLASKVCEPWLKKGKKDCKSQRILKKTCQGCATHELIAAEQFLYTSKQPKSPEWAERTHEIPLLAEELWQLVLPGEGVSVYLRAAGPSCCPGSRVWPPTHIHSSTLNRLCGSTKMFMKFGGKSCWGIWRIWRVSKE